MFLLLPTDRSPHNLIFLLHFPLPLGFSPRSQLAPSKSSLSACLDAVPALCVYMCVPGLQKMIPGWVLQKAHRPQVSQPLCTHLNQDQTQLAAANHCQAKNAFARVGLKHAWILMDWMGKYSARISASAQELITQSSL